MFSSEDLKQSLQKKEEARQKALERRNKLPVWLTTIQFGNATTYRLEMGRRIMGEKVAFYGYSSVSDFVSNERMMLKNALSAGICQHPYFVWHKNRELVAFVTPAAALDYEKYEERRKAIVGYVAMMKMGMI